MTSMAVVRRLPIALLIALLVSAAVGTGVASTDDPEPASMTVAEPMIGDKGTYKITLTGDWSEDIGIADSEPDYEAPWEYLRFAWESDRILDADGAPVNVARLRMTTVAWDYDLFEDTWQLEEIHDSRSYAGEEEISHGYQRLWETSSPTMGVNDISTPALQEGFNMDIDYESYRGFRDDCMLGQTFAGRILVFDVAAALIYSKLVAEALARDQPPTVGDAQIAAVAHRDGIAVASRDIRGSDSLQVTVFDPWHSK